MIKQTKRFSLVIAYALFALFATGCAKKADVSIDDTSKQQEIKQEAPVVEQEEAPETYVTPVEKQSVSTTTIKKDDGLSYVNVVTSNVDGKEVSLKSVHFAFDKFNLTDEMRVITKENYNKINPLVSSMSSLKIKLEGNCDEWGTDEYNYALGLKRAKTVKDSLVNDGVSADRIVMVSFGESNPLCTTKNTECWKKNRRTDYKLLP